MPSEIPDFPASDRGPRHAAGAVRRLWRPLFALAVVAVGLSALAVAWLGLGLSLLVMFGYANALIMLALWANVDVPSLAVLVLEPANGLQQRRLIPCPGQHFGLARHSVDGRFVEANLENIDRHGVGVAGEDRS